MNYLNPKKQSNSGFTLIELLVVISIIGILASVILISLTGVRQKAKDSKIKSEVYGIKLALEDYNATNGGYPSPEGNDFDNAEHPNLWCIGATDCKIIGELIDEEFPTGLADIAFQEKINNLAAIFPNYTDTISYHDAEGNENKGYIYVSCETPNGKVCHSNTEGNYAYIIYPTTDAVKAIRVGTFEEEVCDLSICENNNGGENCACTDPMNCAPYDSSCETNNCGSGNQPCETNDCGPGFSLCPDPMNCYPGISSCETNSCGPGGGGGNDPCYPNPDGTEDPMNCGPFASPCYPGGVGQPMNCGSTPGLCYNGNDPMNCGPGTSPCYGGTNTDPMNCAPGHSACYNDNNPNPMNCSCN